MKLSDSLYQDIYGGLEHMRVAHETQQQVMNETFPTWLDDAGIVTHVWREGPRRYAHDLTLNASYFGATFHLNNFSNRLFSKRRLDVVYNPHLIDRPVSELEVQQFRFDEIDILQGIISRRLGALVETHSV